MIQNNIVSFGSFSIGLAMPGHPLVAVVDLLFGFLFIEPSVAFIHPCFLDDRTLVVFLWAGLALWVKSSPHSHLHPPSPDLSGTCRFVHPLQLQPCYVFRVAIEEEGCGELRLRFGLRVGGSRPCCLGQVISPVNLKSNLYNGIIAVPPLIGLGRMWWHNACKILGT